MHSATALTQQLDRHHPGDQVTLAWTDTGGAQHSATLRLASGPAGCISDEVQVSYPSLSYSSVTARFKALEDKCLIVRGPDERFRLPPLTI